jgi:predicted transcriptional regulator
MANKHQQVRERLAHILARQAGIKANELAKHLGVSLATLHRILAETKPSILVTGKARRTRYALRRPLRGVLQDIPVYQIDEQGQASTLSELTPVYPAGCWMSLEQTDWPLNTENRDGWWEGLPYPIYDIQPQGFMGRQFARSIHQAMDVPENPQHWNDDQILYVLSQKGADLSGNLIVGDPACEHWQQNKLNPTAPRSANGTEKYYVKLAEEALSSGVAGSSAAGEFPKFTATRELSNSSTPHVIVKFSGTDNSPAVTRWRDLLICEHLALQQIGKLPNLASAKSRILHHGNRTFLEVERFDRHGQFGRSPLISLETINAAILGKDPGDWSRLADELTAMGLLDDTERESIHTLWWYGKLIANTDMHLGNLSFRPQQGKLQAAPAYDMLPMLYAPLPGGEVAKRVFEPSPPLPRQLNTWLPAWHAATAFWTTAASDTRITPDFRHTAQENAQKLHILRERIA